MRDLSVCASNLKKRDIHLWIFSDDSRAKLAFVEEGDRNFLGVRDDMVVGEDEAVLIVDEAGATRDVFSLLRDAPEPHELVHPENLGALDRRGADVHHAGEDLFNQVRKVGWSRNGCTRRQRSQQSGTQQKSAQEWGENRGSESHELGL